MTDQFVVSDYDSDHADWQPIAIGTIELTPDQIEQAVTLSQTLPIRDTQWQSYVNALALAGFCEWLEAWAPDLTVDDSHSTLRLPAYASLIDAVGNLQIGAFRLCLVAVNSVADAVVPLPKAVVEVPSLTSQFYVLIEVVEEEMLVRIYGYLRYDQLVEPQRRPILGNGAAWTYDVPLTWFHPDPNPMLLELRCLEPGAIATPLHPAQPEVSLTVLENRLEELIAQGRSPLSAVDQGLSWSEAFTLLMHPTLVEHVMGQVTQGSSSSPSSLSSSLSNTLQALSQQAINAATWLQDQVDAIAQELSWILLPTLAPATAALRSTTAELSSITAALDELGLEIPAAARVAYRDLNSGRLPLRLYAAIWDLSPTIGQPEWALLLILGTQTGNRLPTNVRLQIHDGMQTIVDQRVTDEFRAPYLYTQVEGSWDERFEVSVDIPQEPIEVFVFAFRPNS
jgi:hypothetical protein